MNFTEFVTRSALNKQITIVDAALTEEEQTALLALLEKAAKGAAACTT